MESRCHMRRWTSTYSVSDRDYESPLHRMACRLLNVVLVDGGAASVADSSPEPRCESAWTADDSFDRLLHDDAALQSFQSFLRDEFSEENVIFWHKCELYRKTDDVTERLQAAKSIYVEHVSESAAAQVNIEGNVRETIERQLSTAPRDLFDAAQRHIYLLMKYDSFARFVRAERENTDRVLLPFSALNETVDSTRRERRRWSLLPHWTAGIERRSAAKIRGSRETLGSGADVDLPAKKTRPALRLSRFIKRLSLGGERTVVASAAAAAVVVIAKSPARTPQRSRQPSTPAAAPAVYTPARPARCAVVPKSVQLPSRTISCRRTQSNTSTQLSSSATKRRNDVIRNQ